MISAKKPIARLEFENREPFVSRVVLTDAQWPGYVFQVQIHDTSDKSIHVSYWKLKELQYLEGSVFKPWEDAEPVLLEWGTSQPKDVAPGDKVLVPFARIYPPDFQRVYDAALSGDSNIPQLRFTVARWPRKMRSHVPPGTHRFTLAVYFEKAPPAEIALELEWSGKQQESIELMVKEIKIREHRRRWTP